MKIKAKSSGQSQVVKQDPMGPGTYPTRLVQILDMGTQPQRPYKGQPKDDARELRLTYEFVDTFCIDEDGNEMPDKPRWLSEDFPFHSLQVERARSTARYLALDPSKTFVDSDGEGDWSQLIGAPCSVTITNNPGRGKNEGRVFENISGVAAMRQKDADKLPDLVNPPKLFSVEDPDMEVLKSLPQFLQEKIMESPEYKANAKAGSTIDADQPAGEGEANEDEGGW